MIKLTDKYYIDFEPMNIILKKIVVSKKNTDGQERFVNVSFHGDFESLVKTLLNKQIVDNSDDIKTLQDIIHLLENANIEIIDNLKESRNEKL